MKQIYKYIFGILLALAFGEVAAAATVGSAVGSTATTAAPSTDFNIWGRYTESSLDFKVKVLGSDISVWRTWADGSWQVNRAWRAIPAPIKYQVGVKTVIINGVATTEPIVAKTYIRNNRSYAGGSSGFDRRSNLLETGTGLHWSNRDGDWITYGVSGRVAEYGNRNNNIVSLMYNAAGQKNGVKDHHGNQVLWYTYDVAGNLISVRDYSNREVRYVYNASKQLIEVIDVNGGHTFYTYDTKGLLATKKDPLGRTTTFIYTPEGRLESKKDQDGVGFTYAYNYDKTKKEFYASRTSAGGVLYEDWRNEKGEFIERKVDGKIIFKLADSGRTKIRTDASGNITTEKYDEFDNLVSETFADGTSRSTTYNPKYSLPLTEINESGITTKYIRDPYGNMLSKTEAFGTPEARTTTYTYDTLGQQLTATRGNNTYTYTYDNYGNMTSVTDPLGNTMTYTHDVIGNVLTKTDARAKVWAYTYDAKGNLLTEKDPLGNTTTYTYDGMNNMLSKTDANGNVTSYTYDIRGRLLTITDAAAKQFHVTYNKDGQILTETDRVGKVRTYQYASGRLLNVKDGSNNITSQQFAQGSGGFFDAASIQYPTFKQSYGYDKRNRTILNASSFSGKTLNTRFAYDGIGQIKSVTDANGATRRMTYDPLNRLVQSVMPSGNISAIAYDDRNNPISFTDAKGSITTFAYDAASRLISITRPMGETIRFEYDAEGNLTAIINARNHRRTFAYDSVGRLITETMPATAAGTQATTINYAYDALHNLISWNDGTYSASYTYDALDRLSSETINYGTFSKSYSDTYEANGYKKSMTYPDGSVYAYTYDASNRLQTINVGGKGTVVNNSFQWTAPTKTTLPGGSTQSYALNGIFSIESIAVADPANNPLTSFSYTHDGVQNILSQHDASGNHSYSYDADERLISSNATNYVYDKVGNLLHTGDPYSAWSYNANHELTARPNASYQYDADGNQISKTANGITTTYIYDAANRLIQVKQGASVIADYAYDPFDQRIRKTVGTNTTYYLYAAEGLIGEFDSAGIQAVAYGYLPDGMWGSHPLWQHVGTTYYYYHHNHLGSPVLLTASNGAVVWSASYDTWGKATVTNNTITNNLRLAGQYYDAETGLHYNYRRYYDPSLSRYITTDPIGLAGGSNLYAYVDTNPVNYVDPTGECGLAGAAAGVAGEVIVELLTDGCVSWKGVGFAAGMGAACVPPWAKWASKFGKRAKAPKSADIKVLGRQWDTKVAKNWDGHDVLDLPKGTWNIKKNDQWVSQAIKNKQEFYTASPTKNNLWDAAKNRETVYARELRQIKDAGYVKRGDSYIHPDNL